MSEQLKKLVQPMKEGGQYIPYHEARKAGVLDECAEFLQLTIGRGLDIRILGFQVS